MQLRSPEDVVVYQWPRMWTVQRALVVAAFLGGCVLLGLAWIHSLRRQVQHQTAQIREQMDRQARLEAEVQRAARLESLGVLAGGIAHDFNNLLTVILGNVSLLKLTPPVMQAEGERVREIERGALRARDLTRQLLTFARGGDPLRASTALPDLVRDAVDLVLHGTAVRAHYDFPAGLWNAQIDRDQIAQAIQNITLNSVEALPAGGVIRVALLNLPTAPAGLPAGRYIRLSIADPGRGIAPDVLPRIFDPYFSTKESGGGLGLATVYSIVRKHQGRIEVESQPGRGTLVTLWLPAAETVPVEPAAPEAVPAGPASDQAAVLPTAGPAPLRALVMDDEASIRLLGSMLLGRMGLEATTVADGASAVLEFAKARADGRPFSLLILDLTVPGGLGGQATIAEIRKVDAEVPAIVSSGYSSDPVMANFRSYGFQAVVPKPYDIEQLTETIRRLLPKVNGSKPPG